MQNASDIIRTVSRHTLAYMLFSISEMFRNYDEFDPMDLQKTNMLLLTKVLRDLKRAGINGPDDLRAAKVVATTKKGK